MTGATPFALMLQACGLSLPEAADLHGVRLDTVESWSAGRRPAPRPVLAALAALATRIEAAATAALDEIARIAEKLGPAEAVELGLAADDHEARRLSFPCVGAHRAVLVRVLAAGIADGHHFKIVPHGSTSSTATAIHLHYG